MSEKDEPRMMGSDPLHGMRKPHAGGMVSVILTMIVIGTSAGTAAADSYTTLLKRYEKQIRQQEKQLKTMRGRLEEKERAVSRWQTKAESAKSAWTEASGLLAATRDKVKRVHEKRQESKYLAEAAHMKTTENVLVSWSAANQAKAIAYDLYGSSLLSGARPRLSVEEVIPEFMLAPVARLAASSKSLAEESEKEEAQLRTEEMRWQDEERARSEESARLHEKQENQYLKWQDALRKKDALEEEISQIEESAKALQVMLQEIRDHRDQAKALHENRGASAAALASLRGTLPWPAQGRVVQNFGRQYSDGLNQLVVSNGIKIDAGPSHVVRTIQEGKVLFASPFRQYGQLVIVQHKNGLTSVYGGLGECQVKVEQMLSALDPVGVTGSAGTFYFELRRDEEPMNPLAYLSPVSTSELSSRRTFR